MSLPVFHADILGKLVAGMVWFHTNDENKDHDTRILVSVLDRFGNRLASASGYWGEFRDHSDRGPFQMWVDSSKSREALAGGSFRIRIIPNGNDTWRFSLAIQLAFAGLPNGGVLLEQDEIELNEERATASFPISANP